MKEAYRLCIVQHRSTAANVSCKQPAVARWNEAVRAAGEGPGVETGCMHAHCDLELRFGDTKGDLVDVL